MWERFVFAPNLPLPFPKKYCRIEKTIQEGSLHVLSAVILTVSDSCAAGTRTDTSGPAIRAMLENAGFAVQAMQTVPDEEGQISAAIVHACDILQADLVVTTGGTGLSPRDVTPEATLAVLDREIRAIPVAMWVEGLKSTPRRSTRRGKSRSTRSSAPAA